MNLVFKIILFLMITTISIVFGINHLSLLSSYKSEIPLKNIEREVQVYLDDYGIPHITGQKNTDVYRALGFTVAKERLFQMDLLRRIVQGRLSEIFGDKTLEVDKLMRTLKLKRTAIEQEELIKDTAIHKELSAYLEGIHQVIDEEFLPFEFKILGYKPEYFTVSDIIGVAGYMALTFSDGIARDILNSEMMDKLPDEKVKALRMGEKVESEYQLKDSFGDLQVHLQDTLNEINKIYPLFYGSNSWVLSGKRTKSGKTILANDPHISVGHPSVFYEAHIKTNELEVYGHFIPLAPYPVLGHTPFSAWAVTMSEIDDITVYLEKMNPENNYQVIHDEQWHDLKVTPEVIKVKNAKPVTIEVLETKHGPLLTGTRFHVEGKALALNWSYYHSENNLFKSLYELPRAKTVDEFKNAVSHAASPGLNISWANSEGDIAWWVLGKYPVLGTGVPYDLVLDGSDSQNDITHFTRIDDNPHLINPDNGIIVTANSKPLGEKYQDLAGYWQPAGRYNRIESILSQTEKWDIDATKKLQTDEQVPFHDQFVSQLLSFSNTEFSSQMTEAYEQLKSWNGRCDIKSIGCTIFAFLNHRVMKNLFEDELGEKNFKTFGQTTGLWQSYKYLLKNLENPFWDNVSSQRVESGEEVLEKSFRETIDSISNLLGPEVSRWRWERVHTISYIHPLGKVKPLNMLYNKEKIAVGGIRYSINNIGQKTYSNDFSAAVAPATRRIIDFDNLKMSWGVLAPGNSGNPVSEHFDDQYKLYVNNKYRVQLMDWEKIKKIRPINFIPSYEK